MDHDFSRDYSESTDWDSGTDTATDTKKTTQRKPGRPPKAAEAAARKATRTPPTISLWLSRFSPEDGESIVIQRKRGAKWLDGEVLRSRILPVELFKVLGAGEFRATWHDRNGRFKDNTQLFFEVMGEPATGSSHSAGAPPPTGDTELLLKHLIAENQRLNQIVQEKFSQPPPPPPPQNTDSLMMMKFLLEQQQKNQDREQREREYQEEMRFKREEREREREIEHRKELERIRNSAAPTQQATNQIGQLREMLGFFKEFGVLGGSTPDEPSNLDKIDQLLERAPSLLETIGGAVDLFSQKKKTGTSTPAAPIAPEVKLPEAMLEQHSEWGD